MTKKNLYVYAIMGIMDSIKTYSKMLDICEKHDNIEGTKKYSDALRLLYTDLEEVQRLLNEEVGYNPDCEIQRQEELDKAIKSIQ